MIDIWFDNFNLFFLDSYVAKSGDVGVNVFLETNCFSTG